MRFEELPTLVRRTFGDYLSAYAEENPAARFQAEGQPRVEDGVGFVVPYVDLTSSTHYEVAIGPDGAVKLTKQIA